MQATKICRAKEKRGESAMISKTVGYFAVCSAFIFVSGAQGIGQGTERMAQLGVGEKKVTPIDFRALKALLPESLPGMKRAEATGERTSAFGIRMSNAKGRYEAEGGGNIHIEISDMGSMTGMAAAVAAWLNVEIDRESDKEYEKTTTIGGHRAHERYNQEDKSGEIQVVVGGRFMVNVKGSEVKMDAIKEALGKLDLAKLDAMKTQGVEQ